MAIEQHCGPAFSLHNLLWLSPKTQTAYIAHLLQQRLCLATPTPLRYGRVM